MQTNDRGPRKGASAFDGKDMEFRRSSGEFRASPDQGVIEGYVTKWGTVDDYNSTFERGCFAKTLKERGARVKVLWNHSADDLIGKPLELREDDIGLWARLKLVLPVQRANEAYELAKAEALDSFSFGFRTVRDAWVDGVRRIKEVVLMEVSPVVFEANENALITGVRTMKTAPTEFRAEDFAATYMQTEMPRRHRVLMDALEWTLNDIWWSDPGAADGLAEKMGDCLAKFSAAYGQYVQEYIAAWGANAEQRSAPSDSDLSRAMREAIQSQRHNSPEALAATTSLTAHEVRSLMRGEIGVAPAKLAELPEEVRKAYGQRRAAVLEQVCAELRAGLSQAEKDRLAGLLGMHAEHRAAPCEHDAVALLERFSASLKT